MNYIVLIKIQSLSFCFLPKIIKENRQFLIKLAEFELLYDLYFANPFSSLIKHSQLNLYKLYLFIDKIFERFQK